MSEALKAKVRSDKLRQNPLALMRAVLADQWFSKLRRALYLALRAQVYEVAKRVEIGLTEPVTDSMEIQWYNEMVTTKRPMVMAMVESGRELGELEMAGRSGQPWEGLVDRELAIQILGKQGEADAVDDFLLRARTEDVEKYLKTTSKLETRTSRAKYQKLYENAVSFWDAEKQQGLTPAQMAKQIRAKGLALSDTRANLMARTISQWAHNEGVHQIYQEQGVQAEEWVVTLDDVLCPHCRAMDGVTVATADPFIPASPAQPAILVNDGQTLKVPFDVQHPPLHPYCRCVIVPVI